MVIGWIGDYEETSLSGVLYIGKKVWVLGIVMVVTLTSI